MSPWPWRLFYAHKTALRDTVWCNRSITTEGTPLDCPGSDRRCCHCQLSARPRCLLVWADMFGGGVPGNYEKSGPENGKIVIVPLITHAGDTDMQPVFYSIEQRSTKCLLANFPCWDAARKCCNFYSGTSQKWFGGCGGQAFCTTSSNIAYMSAERCSLGTRRRWNWIVELSRVFLQIIPPLVECSNRRIPPTIEWPKYCPTRSQKSKYNIIWCRYFTFCFFNELIQLVLTFESFSNVIWHT